MTSSARVPRGPPDHGRRRRGAVAAGDRRRHRRRVGAGRAATRVAACAPDEDTLTLAWDAATAALDAAGIERRRGRRDLLGHQPPALRRGPEPRLPRRVARPVVRRRRRAARGLGALGHGGAHRGADAIAAGSARIVLVVASDALRPGLGTGFEARCGAGAAAVVLATEGDCRRSAPA